MNWRRGLFRVWLVFSIGWAVLVAAAQAGQMAKWTDRYPEPYPDQLLLGAVMAALAPAAIGCLVWAANWAWRGFRT